ncbi:MAG TPA: response regulator, partial [Bryobacteraceae bacterium]|nr:response regulator [Bryobacteraceae bacterium]
SYAVQLAAVAGVRKLFLTHHDPLHPDDFLQDLEHRAQALAGPSLQVQCAREGYEESFESSGVQTGAAVAPERPDIAHSTSLRILIVDDDEDLRVLARRALERAGHSVMEAENGAECLSMVSTGKPQLIILDLNMPGMDGYTVLRELRGRDDAKTLPVIVLTAQGDEESARSSFGHGATDFLAKPFTPPQLDARVRSCFVHAARG